MKYTLWLALVAVGGCTYTVTDDARVADLASQLSNLQQRQDATDQRLNTQSEEIGRLRRVFK